MVTVMNTTIRQLLNSIKFRSNKGESGALRLVLGERQVEVPLDIKLTYGDGYAFVSIPKMVGIFKVNEDAKTKKLTMVLQKDMDNGKAASAALTPLLPVSASRTIPVPDIDPELTSALTKIPAGYKLIATPEGAKLVRQRAKSEPKADEGKTPDAPKGEDAKKEAAGAGGGKK
jgi:hypothetical protein